MSNPNCTPELRHSTERLGSYKFPTVLMSPYTISSGSRPRRPLGGPDSAFFRVRSFISASARLLSSVLPTSFFPIQILTHLSALPIGSQITSCHRLRKKVNTIAIPVTRTVQAAKTCRATAACWSAFNDFQVPFSAKNWLCSNNRAAIPDGNVNGATRHVPKSTRSRLMLG